MDILAYLLMVIGVFILPIAQQSVFANHGKEITLKLSDAQFYLPLVRTSYKLS